MNSLSTSMQPILFVDIFHFEGARFAESQIRNMVERTRKKLLKAGIDLQVNEYQFVKERPLSLVNDQNVEQLLLNYGTPKTLRLYFVREYAQPQFDSWTYDPVYGKDADHWKGAVFITDAWAGADEHLYEFRGFPKEADILLHELGHVLLQDANHIKDETKKNFFHHDSQFCDDTIEPEQARKMQMSPYLKLKKVIQVGDDLDKSQKSDQG